MDYFPLSVDYEERCTPWGKIPGGFKKREGRASDKAILTARLIDRPIRPLFPKGMYNDVSVVATVLSVDTNIPPEVFGMIGSSIALSISDIPFAGPTGSVVVGLVDGEYVINPDSAQRAKSKLHLSLSGTRDAIMMVEAGADVVTEKEMLGAILFGHEEIKKIVAFIDGIVAEVGKPKIDIELETIPADIDAAVRAYADKKMDYVLESFDRTERDHREDELNADVLAHFADDFNDVARRPSSSSTAFTTSRKRRSAPRSWTAASVPTAEVSPTSVPSGAKWVCSRALTVPPCSPEVRRRR